MKCRLVLIYLLGLLPVILFAVPGNRKPIKKDLPDGKSLTIIVNGDEFFNWLTTADGYFVSPGKDGFYYYMEEMGDSVGVSDIKAYDTQYRSQDEKEYLEKNTKQLLPALKKRSNVSRIVAPITNAGKGSWLLEDNPFRDKVAVDYIVIPVNFADKKLKFTEADFERLCNEEGLSEWGLRGSVKDYFEDMSFGRFSPRAIVMPVMESYYNSRYIASSQGTYLDNSVFNHLSSNGYNWGDVSKHGAPKVVVIFPGFSQSETGDPNDIWANSHTVSKADKTIYQHYINIIYTPEFDKYPEELPGTYTFCHEFSHTLGAPDLYDTNAEVDGQHFEHKNWDIMVGSDSRDAPSHNSFVRYRLGWIDEAIELTQPSSVMIKDVETERCGYFYKTGTEGEFFWLENRQKQKWDMNIPNSGMLIYHVDSVTWTKKCRGYYSGGMVSGLFYRNQINADASRPGFDLEEADGLKDYETRAGDCFPGSSGITEFSDNTFPDSKDYAGTATGKSLKNIRLSDNTIFFDFMGGGDPVTEIITRDIALSSENGMKIISEIKRGGNINISEAGVYYGLTEMTVKNKVKGKIQDDNVTTDISGLKYNIAYYVKPYIIVNGKEITGPIKNKRTVLNKVSGFPVTFDFTKSETMNSIIPEANTDGYSPEFKESSKTLNLPLSSKAIMPMMNVTKNKPVYINYKNPVIINPDSFTPYLYYRYGYDDEWKAIKEGLINLSIIPEESQIQFAIGAEQEYSYFFGSYTNYDFPPYYKRIVSYSPVITFSDIKPDELIITDFPFSAEYDSKSDYSLWGEIPSGNYTDNNADIINYPSENFRLLTSKTSVFKSDIILPKLNTSGLKNPTLKFIYNGINGEGLYVKYRTDDSQEWKLLLYDNLPDAETYYEYFFKDYYIDLPKEKELQLKIYNLKSVVANYGVSYGRKGAGNLIKLKVGEKEDQEISFYNIIQEKPVVRTELFCDPSYYSEAGIVINNKEFVKNEYQRSSVSNIRVPGLKENETAQIKSYLKTHDGRIIYSDKSISVTQPAGSGKVSLPEATLVDTEGYYSYIRSNFYPGNKSILIQGVCWSSTDKNPTIDNCEGIIITEDSYRERLDSLTFPKSDGYYYLRPFVLYEGESLYNYGNYIFIKSKARYQTEFNLPYVFSEHSIYDIKLYWNYTGRWNISSSQLKSEFDCLFPEKLMTMESPLITYSKEKNDVLKIKGNVTNTDIYVVDELSGNRIKLDLYRIYDSSSSYKLPDNLEKFRICIETANRYNNDCSIYKIEIIKDNTWDIHSREPEKDAQGRYLITDEAELAWVSLYSYSENETFEGESFIQMADLDLSSAYWVPVGKRTSSSAIFKGNYYGNGFTIKGLTVDKEESELNDYNSYSGLFGFVENSIISDVVILSGNVKGSKFVGGLVAYMNNGHINNCINFADVDGLGSVGGLVGSAYGTLKMCINGGNIKSSYSEGYNIGGLCGFLSGNIIGCANWGDISGYELVGGLVGRPYYLSTINGSYNAGSVYSEQRYSCGAISTSVIKSGSGLYYNSDINPGIYGFESEDKYAIPKSTAELRGYEVINDMNKAIEPYLSESKWIMNSNYEYPVINTSSLISGVNSVVDDVEKINIINSVDGIEIVTFEAGNIYI